MILTTTNDLQGRTITQYLGVATGEVIVGANIFRDMFAAVRDIVGGRAGGYENALKSARRQALDELADEARDLGADAVLGVAVDYGSLGANGSMLLVAATGTAVKLG